MSNYTLTRTSPVTSVYDGQRSWTMTVSVTDSIEALGPKILVMHADGDVVGDVFSCIASLQQMLELPEDAPVVVDDMQVPFYRVSTLDFVAYSQWELKTLWDKILEDVHALTDNYNAQTALSVTETVDIL